MSQLLDAAAKYFRENQWPSLQLGDASILTVNYEGQNGAWECYADAREDQQRFLFYSIAPIKAPEDSKAKMAELLTRANYGLMIGNFEMDFEDGEIRYKTSIDVQGSELSTALISQLVSANVFTMDKYLPGIMTVASDHASPEQAIALVETEGSPA